MTKPCISLMRLCALQILITLSANAAAQQPYPSKPVRFIVPFAPGGGTDITARLIGQKLSELWNVPVVIDNRPGAGSTVGTDMAAKAAPDGYTIGVTSMSHPINATLYRTLPYDTMKDFEFIMLTVRVPNVLVVHPSVPAKSVKELVALARSQPGRLNFPSSGVGGVSHLAAEVFCATAGIEGVHVPYKGAGPAMTALVGGEGQVMMATIPLGERSFDADICRFDDLRPLVAFPSYELAEFGRAAAGNGFQAGVQVYGLHRRLSQDAHNFRVKLSDNGCGGAGRREEPEPVLALSAALWIR